MSIDRRALLGLGLAGLAGCAAPSAPGASSTSSGTSVKSSAAGAPSASSMLPAPTVTATPAGGEKPWGDPDVKLGNPIGDGSMAPSPDPQPFQRPITKLAKGEKPPQFVVFSWDGSSGNDDAILEMIQRAHSVNGTMTMFLTSIYVLPQSKKTEYQPPNRPAGASDIPYMSDKTVRRTIIDISTAWKYGNEIGTHFGGHFDATKWTPADWEIEVDQAYKLVTHWRTNTGWTDIEPFPFDYNKELVGARTPLLAGRAGLLPVVAKRGWRYDTSGVRTMGWPKKDQYGIYDMSMFSVPFRKSSQLPMDYNYYATQAGGKPGGTAAQRATWQAEHKASLRAGLKACLASNRPPFIIGNHLSPWLGGIYQQNLKDLIIEFGQTPEVQLVSHRWLCDWLDAQDPAVLADLQKV